MIERLFRWLAIRRRIIAGFLILVVLSALSVPLVVANQRFILGRLQQITDVEARAERLLLLASTRVESSRVNLIRYIQDDAPSTSEALQDIDRASQLLAEAQGLITPPDQQTAVETVLATLSDYRNLVGDVETARSEAEGQQVSPILVQVHGLGNNIGQQIEEIVGDSEARIRAANEAIYADVQEKLILLGCIYVGLVIVAIVLARLIQRSITAPIAKLQSGVEAFYQGQMDTSIPIVGRDELSLLAQAFNRMASQLRDLVSTLDRRVADRTHTLEKRSVQLEAAGQVARDAASVLDPQQLLDQVVMLVSEQFEFYHTGIFLLDGEGKWAVLQAASSEGGRRLLVKQHRLPLGTGIVGYVAAQGEPRIALDVGTDAAFFDNPDLPGTRSEMALPLRVRDEIIGVLDVQSREPAAFSDDDVAVLQTLADQVAVAISNANLFQRAQESLEEQRRAYGALSREAWADLLKAEPDLSILRDQRGFSLTDAPWQPHMETALRSGRIIPSFDGASSLAIPLKSHGQVIGVIEAQKPDGSGQWVREEVEVLETLADRLGVTLESARLFQETQRRATQDRLLGEITTRIRQTLDMDTVLKTAAQEVRQALGLPEVVVRLRSASRPTTTAPRAGKAQGRADSNGAPGPADETQTGGNHA